jgi:ABC-type lipoprotein release transport system permease subunit
MLLLIKIAWRNLWRNKRRTILTVTSVSLGLALLLISLGIGDGGHKQMVESAVRLGSGHVLIQADGYQESGEFKLTLSGSDLERIDIWLEGYAGNGTIPIKQSVRRCFVSGMLSSADGASGALVTGVEPAKELSVSRFAEKVIEGTFFEGSYLNPAVIGKGIADKLELDIGDKAVLMAQGLDGEDIESLLLRICGIIDFGTDQFNQTMVMIDLADFQKNFRMGDSIHQTALFTEDSDLSKKLAQTAAEQFSDLEILTWAEALPELRDAIELDDGFNYFFQGTIFILIAFTVMNTLLMSVLERKREFSLLEAIGLSPGGRFRMIMLEAFFVSLMSVVVGFLIGYSVHLYLKIEGLPLDAFYEGDFDFGGVIMDPVMYSDLSLSRVAGSIFMVTAITIVLAIIPAIRAARAGDVHMLSGK